VLGEAMKIKLEKQQKLRASIVSVTCGVCKKTAKEFGQLFIRMSYTEKIHSFICRKCLEKLNIKDSYLEDVFSAVVREGIKQKLDITEARHAAYDLEGQNMSFNRLYSEKKHDKHSKQAGSSKRRVRRSAKRTGKSD